MSASVCIQPLHCFYFRTFYLVYFELFCMSKMLKYISVSSISYCYSHIIFLHFDYKIINCYLQRFLLWHDYILFAFSSQKNIISTFNYAVHTPLSDTTPACIWHCYIWTGLWFWKHSCFPHIVPDSYFSKSMSLTASYSSIVITNTSARSFLKQGSKTIVFPALNKFFAFYTVWAYTTPLITGICYL